MNFPVLLDMEAPEVYAYSIYSVLAEKFEAFVSLGLANGRYKDFIEDTVRQNRWNLFVKKKKTMVKVDFRETIEQVKKLLLPIVEYINKNEDFCLKWSM